MSAGCYALMAGSRASKLSSGGHAYGGPADELEAAQAIFSSLREAFQCFSIDFRLSDKAFL